LSRSYTSKKDGNVRRQRLERRKRTVEKKIKRILYKERSMREYVVEYLGTVFFLYVVVVTQNAFAIGAALALCIYLGGAISGGNFNPASTLLMVLTGKEPSHVLAPYIIAQLAAVFTVHQIYKRLKK